jgi:hypothetical protein
VPIAFAEEHDLPFDRSNPETAGGLVGSVTRYRWVLVVSLAGFQHVWPCDFLDSPLPRGSGGQGPASVGAELYGVLGRAGFLDDYAICIGDGYLTITRQGRLRRWLHRLWRRLWSWLARHRSPDEPL